MSGGTAALPEMAAMPRQRRFSSSLLWMVLAYGVPTVLFLVTQFMRAPDYLGRDNDDAMRLVEVRDLLAGQSWFDLTQPRLGLEGGTLMHWSRLIDLPIAGLMSMFRPFVGVAQAEILALAIWPMALAVALLAARPPCISAWG